jgi:TldD protein
MQTQPRLLDTATQTLLVPYGLDAPQIGDVFGTIMTRKVDYADLYFQYYRHESWSLEEGIVKSGSFAIDQGVGVRAIAGEKTAFAYSDDISLPALRDAAGATRAIARAGGKSRVPAVRASTGRALYEPMDPLASLGDTEKVRLLERLERLCRARDPRVAQVMASIAGEYEAILVARSDALIAADVRPLVRVSLTVIVEEGGRKRILHHTDKRRKP